MWTACCGCLAGDQQNSSEEPYSLNVNAGTQVPSWSSDDGSNMFPTPALRPGNQIIIKGQMTEDRRLHMKIQTTGDTILINVANGPNKDKDFVKIITQGEQVYKSEASEWFNDGTKYIFRFHMRSPDEISIYAGIEEKEGDQYLKIISVNINNLSMISVDGQVEKLTYLFA